MIRVVKTLALSILIITFVNKFPAQDSSSACLSAVGYYIAVRATLNSEDQIDLFGASNLPPGSILGVQTYDFLGQGARVLNDDVSVMVGKDGLFRAAIHPKKVNSFRRNMICDVIFMPTYPRQPAAVIKVVGKAGEHLRTAVANPQVEGNPRVSILRDATVVQ